MGHQSITHRNILTKREKSREFKKAMTEAETVLWSQIRANKLHNLHFRRQQIIGGFIVDFYCHSIKLAIELDGAVHEQQRDYDNDRDNVLTSLGITTLLFRNEEIYVNLSSILLTIAKYSAKDS